MTVSKLKKQLTQARAELDAINQELASLDAERAGALANSTAYTKWRQAKEAAELEHDRLVSLAEKLAADLDHEKADADLSALESRKADLEKESRALACRIAEEGGHAAAVLIKLAGEARANADAVAQLNRELGEDEQLMDADHLARHRDPAPREDLESTTVDLWVFERTDELVGDPDLVREISYERGVIPPIGAGPRATPVVRKRFRQIRYLAPGDREYTESLASVLRLPRFNGPGMMFDRGRVVETAPRRELLELIPAPDASAQPANIEAA
jgi:hypothetical protein